MHKKGASNSRGKEIITINISIPVNCKEVRGEIAKSL